MLALNYFSCALETWYYPGLYSSKPDNFSATFNLAAISIMLSKTPSLLWAGAVLQGKEGKNNSNNRRDLFLDMIMIIIFSRCHFKAAYLGLKARQAEGPMLGLYAHLRVRVEPRGQKGRQKFHLIIFLSHRAASQF